MENINKLIQEIESAVDINYLEHVIETARQRLFELQGGKEIVEFKNSQSFINSLKLVKYLKEKGLESMFGDSDIFHRIESFLEDPTKEVLEVENEDNIEIKKALKQKISQLWVELLNMIDEEGGTQAYADEEGYIKKIQETLSSLGVRELKMQIGHPIPENTQLKETRIKWVEKAGYPKGVLARLIKRELVGNGIRQYALVELVK